jgi:aldehyde:ferredoxin oxidoreductase
MVSRREGFGDVLAEGVKRAAEKLGGPAGLRGLHREGATPRGHDHRAMEEMLDGPSSTATMETGNPVHPTEIGQPARINPFDGEQVAKYVAGLRGRRSFEDSLGICIFTSRTRLENSCRALSAATGWTFTVDEALRFGRRTAAINRATALRCGHTGAMEYPSARMGSTPVDGPRRAGHPSAVGKDARHLVREVGFDRKTGKPWPKTRRAGSRLALEGPLGQVVRAERPAKPSERSSLTLSVSVCYLLALLSTRIMGSLWRK